MVNPVTVNVGIIVPLTGADVDTWGEDDVNPNMVAIDGLFAGVQTIAVTNVPVTLTKPVGFTPTPSAGPTQSQNRVLRFTGALSADVRVTLPLPGSYLIDNRTTGNFVLSFQGVTATEVVGIEQGAIVEIYNDGANVRFVNFGRVGELELWSGIIVIPAWVNACTVKPYVRADGSVYNFSDFPWLAQRLLGQFGGNGVTTFAVPDAGGRLLLGYDYTAARITVAGGAGFNGATIGAANANSSQGSQLVNSNMPPYTPTGSVSTTTTVSITTAQGYQSGGVVQALCPPSLSNVPNNVFNGVSSSSFSGGAQGGTSAVFSNVPPAQVVGIWVVKT